MVEGVLGVFILLVDFWVELGGAACGMLVDWAGDGLGRELNRSFTVSVMAVVVMPPMTLLALVVNGVPCSLLPLGSGHGRRGDCGSAAVGFQGHNSVLGFDRGQCLWSVWRWRSEAQ